VYTYSGPFREAQISEQPLWGFSSSNPDRSQSRAENTVITNSFGGSRAYGGSYADFVSSSAIRRKIFQCDALPAL
jgi:hypothetical protein